MSAVDTTTINLSAQVLPVLNSMSGMTVDQKIARLLLNEIRRYLEGCERELVELELRYGMDYSDFQRKVKAGEFGEEFAYPLEADTMRWEDLLAEKKHWLEQASLLKGFVE